MRTGINYVTTRLLNKNSRKLTTREPGDERDTWEKVADFLEEQELLRDKTADDKIQQHLREARLKGKQEDAAVQHSARLTKLARMLINELTDPVKVEQAEQLLEDETFRYQAERQAVRES